MLKILWFMRRKVYFNVCDVVLFIEFLINLKICYKGMVINEYILSINVWDNFFFEIFCNN